MARKIIDTRKPCPTHLMWLIGNEVGFAPTTGGKFVGTVDEINGLLTAMGYHEVAIRTNIMSRAKYLEAKLTPVYMSPACESYWSM